MAASRTFSAASLSAYVIVVVIAFPFVVVGVILADLPALCQDIPRRERKNFRTLPSVLLAHIFTAAHMFLELFVMPSNLDDSTDHESCDTREHRHTSD